MAELKNTETTFPVSREKKTEETNNIAKTETKSTQNLTVTKTQSTQNPRTMAGQEDAFVTMQAGAK